jgi:hypothetical protein
MFCQSNDSIFMGALVSYFRKGITLQNHTNYSTLCIDSSKPVGAWDYGVMTY